MTGKRSERVSHDTAVHPAGGSGAAPRRSTGQRRAHLHIRGAKLSGYQISRLKKLMQQVKWQANRPLGLAIGYAQDDSLIEVNGDMLTEEEFRKRYASIDGEPRALIVKFISGPTEGGTKN